MSKLILRQYDDELSNVNIKKNKIYPIVILMIVSMIVGVAFGLVYVAFMGNALYTSKNKGYDNAAAVTAKMIDAKLDKTMSDLSVYAISVLDKYNERSYADIITEMHALAAYNDYIEMYCVDTNGSGFNHNGNLVEIANEDFFKNASQTDAIVTNCEKDGNPAFVYVVPVVENKENKGYIVAKITGVMEMKTLGVEDWSAESAMYILDGNNNIIARDTKSTADFDLENLSEKDVIYTADKTLLNSVMENYSIQNIVSYFQTYVTGLSEEESGRIFENAGKTWFSKDIGKNNWRLVMGRQESYDDDLGGLIGGAIMAVGVVFMFQLAVFVAIILLQLVANKKLTRMLYLDPVTQGDNWYKFKLDLARLIRRKSNFALVVISPKKYRLFEDMYGHTEAKNLLVAIYKCLNSNKSRGELAVRRANEEFVMLLEYSSYDSLIERLKALMKQLCTLEKKTDIHYSAGIYPINSKETSADKMDIFANIAKDTVEDTMTSTMAFFDDEMRTELIKEKEIENTMDTAIGNREFIVYLQPKYSTETEEMCGAEALVRWISDAK